jgi:dTDP-4-amino-4,6-dideoxygalactose transaminase
MTFTATAEIVRYLGADPVFLDVEYGTGLVTPDIVADAIVRHPDVRFLIVVHYGGQAARMISGNGRGILDICRDKGIGVIEDAAHAFPCRHAGRFVGSIGDATCFSFYANKTITTAEGGMLTTNDLGIAKRARIMRLHGIDRDIWQRFTSSAQEWEYDVIAPGFKYNMPDLNAAVGLAQLEKAEEHRRDRQRVAEMYFAGLVGIEGIDLPNCACTMEEHAWHLFPIVLNEHSRVSRNELIRKLAERGIGTSVHYKPIHRMTYYAERYRLKPEDFPVAERIWHGTLSLPIYSSLTDNEVDYVCGSLRDLLGAR